jgi:outer membrane protein OmpA-like peptidoglycan-associated protein
VTDKPQADVAVTPDLAEQKPAEQKPAEQKPASTSGDDEDSDGVNNQVDVCPNSSQGYPVRENGCALYDGILRGVQFIEGTDELQSTAFLQLDYLASSLKQFPQAKVELRAHTDTLATSKEQSILTRARLKAVGTYLVRQGVSANRLILRSFGGTRPLYNSREVEGRRGNNRIEVIESSK